MVSKFEITVNSKPEYRNNKRINLFRYDISI